MKFRLRVAAALSAVTALAGFSVVAAVPASATVYYSIVSDYSGNFSAGIFTCLVATDPAANDAKVFAEGTSSCTNWSRSESTVTYGGDTYYQYSQAGTNFCLEWYSAGGYVREATCNSSTTSPTLAQWWWGTFAWNGKGTSIGKLRNLYSEENSQPPCLYYDAETETDELPTVASCASAISDWFSG